MELAPGQRLPDYRRIVADTSSVAIASNGSVVVWRLNINGSVPST
jgi:hypothetical protein